MGRRRYPELIDGSIEDGMAGTIYFVGRVKKTCRRGIAGGGRPRSQMGGYFCLRGREEGRIVGVKQ